MRAVRLVLRRPGATLGLAALLLVVVQVGYGKFGRGVEFFPAVEPDYGQVIVHARGNLSLDEKDRFLAEAEKRVLEAKGLKTVYTRVGEQPKGSNELSEDTIGVIQFEFADWRTRPPAHEIMDGIRTATADIPGILVEVTAPRAGPPTGKPIQVQIGALDPELLPAAAKKVAAMLAQRSDIQDLDDGLPLPGIDWKVHVDQAEAAKFAANPAIVGTALQLVTNGIKATEYRPAGSDKAVDILVRFPEDRRSLDQMDELRVQTPSGSVPISNFVERVAAPRVGFINRVAGNRVMTVSANVAQGVQTAKVQEEIAKELATADLGPGVTWRLKGEDEERAKAGAFLMKAFGTAIFLIFAILLAQFNRLTSVGLVLSAVILSTIGVLLGLHGDGPAVRRGDDRHRRDRQRRRDRQQQHRADRHLRPAAARGLGGLRRHRRDLPRARAAGGADGGHRRPRRAADRVRRQHRVPHPRDIGRRAGDAVVDQPLDRHRVRPGLCDGADAVRHAGRADGDRDGPRPAQGLGCGIAGAFRACATITQLVPRLFKTDLVRVPVARVSERMGRTFCVGDDAQCEFFAFCPRADIAQYFMLQ